MRGRALWAGLGLAALAVSASLNVALWIYYGRWRSDQRAALRARLATAPSARPALILGDSIVAPLEGAEPRVFNLAVSGATVHWIRSEQIPLVRDLQPRHILIAAGINDLRAGESPERVAQELADLARELRVASAQSSITVLSVLPLAAGAALTGPVTPDSVAETNRLVQASAGPGVFTFVHHGTLLADRDGLAEEYTDDGLHLNASGLERLHQFLHGGIAEGRWR